ncbi:DUF2145 domain-containing protein [Amantichitinum ursilacus]|uniref:DUF2145 domain-containing protein n=1 Tax=Amantichitinum ursilacus TaxID=857265 RepID=A0A0N1JTN6_9NEIS|nr:DUF2145 domain-containing protein [Amantichitinum ursilacus]KPC55274.1 hypothetical protein WG78_01410 [Amantichitinum ursilacus]
MFRLFARFALALCTCLSATAFAGQTCSEKPLSPEVIRSALLTGYNLQQKLDKLAPRVALLARVGQDLREYKLHYSHIAFVSREADDQPWQVSHLLNDCGAATSALWHEGLGNFFLDDMFAYDALVLIPDAATQNRLWNLLHDPAALERLHSSSYNVVAYPFSTLHQNSNQWVLEVMAQAFSPEPLGQRASTQAWLRANGYSPSTLQINPLKRLGGRVFKANVAFDDHPFDRRMGGQIDTVTVESVMAFLQRLDPGEQERHIPPPDLTRPGAKASDKAKAL